MKKLLYVMFAVAMVSLASCEKDEIGGTATQALAGQWYVTVDAVDANGDVVYEDFFGMGRILNLTFNTVENVDNRLYVSDLSQFWSYQVEVSCDPQTLTFGNTDWADNVLYDYYDPDELHVLITDGKIVKNGAVTPSGMPADYIEYYVSFDDDPYPDWYGYDRYRVSGYRYTGFAADDE